jgi:hypothetical protein
VTGSAANPQLVQPERFVQGDMNGAILLLALGRRLVHHDCTVPLAGSAQGLGQLVSTTLEVAIACRPALTRPGLPRASMDETGSVPPLRAAREHNADDSRPPTDLAVLARAAPRRTTDHGQSRGYSSHAQFFR